MTTTRAIGDEVRNALDYLAEAELAAYVNPVAIGPTRVTWHPHKAAEQFIITREHPDIEQYLSWVSSGHYSAALTDGSLLQITYDVEGGTIVGHRLAYLPCPYKIDEMLLAEGEPLLDVVLLERDTDALLRSPVRFDFDGAAARSGHPAAHLTLNSNDCRIACGAPVHVLRFLDFIFRHFYTALWAAHAPFFEVAAFRHAGPTMLQDEERRHMHVAWDYHARKGS